MAGNTPEPKKLIQDIVGRIARPMRDMRLLPPPNMWQRFWLRRPLRLAVGVCVIAILVAGIAASVYHGFLKDRSLDIRAYVPRDAWMYVEFDLQENEWVALINKAPHLAGQVNEFMVAHGLNQSLLQGSTGIGLVGMYDEYTPQWVWLLKSDDRQALESFVEPGMYAKHVGVDIIAFAPEKSLLKKVRDRGVLVSALQYPSETLWTGFVAPKHIPLKHNAPIQDEILHGVMSAVRAPNTLPFAVFLHEQGLSVHVGETPSLSDDEDWGFVDATQQYDVVLHNINLTHSVRQLERIMEPLPVAQFFVGRAKAYMREHYGSGWERIIDMFNAPSTLVLTSLVPKADTVSWREGIGAALMVERTFVPYEHDLVLFTLSNTLARIEPELVEYTLPDRSVGYERIADPGRYAFERDEHNVYTVHVPERAEDVIVRPGKDEYLISNDHELFSTLATDGLGVPDEYCTHLPEYALLSHNTLSYLPFVSDFSAAAISRDTKSLRLCLEF